MNSLRYAMTLALAVSIAWPWSTGDAWGQAEASPVLPAAFAPRQAYLVTDPDEPPADDQAATAIGVRAEMPGRLALVDGVGQVVALDENEQPVVLHDWRHAADAPVPDTPFLVRFLPAGDSLGVERLLRARAGEPLWLTLHRSADASGWRLTSAEPDAFAPPTASRPETSLKVVEDDAALERELAALLQFEEGPPPTAAQLREEGLQMIVEGEYATALELLERRLDIEPDPAVSGQAASVAPGEAAIPDGWVLHETFGLTFAMPANWEVMRASKDRYVLAAPGFAPREKKGLGLGIQRLDADDFIDDFLENPTFSALLDADNRSPLSVASGIAFDRFTALPEQTGTGYATEGAVSRYRHAQDGHLLLTFIAFDSARLAENAPLIERVFSTLRLSAPAQFRAETTLVSEGAAAPSEASATLGGLVTVRLPNGWRLEPGEQEVTLRTEPVFSAVITLRRGKAAREALALDDLFQGEPYVSTGRILGQSARIFSGPAAYVGMQSGTRLEQGEVRVYLLEQCLPNGAPVMIDTMAAPGWLQDHDLTSVMAAIEADWPTGMRPCHPAVTARATWVMEDMLAFVLPEGFETGRSRSSFWIRTTSGPYASLGVGTGPDAFPSDFRLIKANSLGNGFIAAPEARRVTLMGEPASLFEGHSQAGEGSRVQHVALLDRCLPDGSPVVVTLRADDAWLSANGGFEALLNRAWLFLPEGARACDPALLQTAIEVSEADAVEGIEPAEDGPPIARGKTAAAGSAPSAPGGGGPSGLAGEALPVLDGDMSHWSVSAAEFAASEAEITANPGGDGRTSYYVAPALAGGDWSHVRALRLDKKSHGGSYYAEGYGSEGDIVLEGPAGRATYALPEHHSGEWRHFEIPLNEPGWRLSQGAESLADVLRSVTALRIRAEYGAGTDVSGLRNVSLVVRNQESPGQTAEQLRAAGLQSLLDGDYETALDRLERSLALKHDEALAGRVERLRLFLKVRSDSDPASEARGE